jgi:membrane protein implicated in regulation of membrane protease activity
MSVFSLLPRGRGQIPRRVPETSPGRGSLRPPGRPVAREARRRLGSLVGCDPALSGTRGGVLPIAIGVALFFVLPYPWNGVGLAAALLWEIAGTVYGLWWSHRAAPLVGSSSLIGLSATVAAACAPRGRVRIGGETWQARSQVAVGVGQRVRVHSVEGLTLHVEPESPTGASPLASGGPPRSVRSAGSQGGWLWLL